MSPDLVIGYGNPLRSDDGVGWCAAQRLAEQLDPQEVRVEAAHQLTPEMAEWIAQAEHVIFIDACWHAVPGRIQRYLLRPVKGEIGSLTHHVDPAKLLEAAKLLYGKCPPALLFSISGQTFEHGEELSPMVAVALQALVERIKGILEEYKTNSKEAKKAHA